MKSKAPKKAVKKAKSSRDKSMSRNVKFVLKGSPISAKRISTTAWLSILERMIRNVQCLLTKMYGVTTARQLLTDVDPVENVTRRLEDPSNIEFCFGFDEHTRFIFLFSDTHVADDDHGQLSHLILTCEGKLLVCHERYWVGKTQNNRIVSLLSFCPIPLDRFKFWSTELRKRTKACLGHCALKKLQEALQDTIGQYEVDLRELRAFQSQLVEVSQRVRD